MGRQVLFPKNSLSSRCEIPRCEACQYAKQKRRVPPSKLQITRKENEGGISDGVLTPGGKVSVDLYVAGIGGRLPHTKGSEDEDRKYAGGAIFLDISSGFLFVNHQPNLTAAMTVASKHKFERFCSEFGVHPKEYLADNHPFRSAEFVQDCTNQRQKLLFSGVGAKHQNRVERSIQTIFNWSRALMLHFILHWPQESRLDLWPFAVTYAVWIWNNLPAEDSGLSPVELFTRTTMSDYRDLQRVRVFGCPVYVLDPKLQDAKKIPKWNKRSWKGIFVGFSPSHSSTVVLVLNPQTGHISPQYHVVFDERFSTVSCSPQDESSLESWDNLLNHGYDRHFTIEPPEEGNETPHCDIPPVVEHSMFRPRPDLDHSIAKREAEQSEEDDIVPWDLPPNIDLWPTHRNTISNGQERKDSDTQTDPMNQEVSIQTDPVSQREQDTQTDPSGQQRERQVRFSEDTKTESENIRVIGRSRSGRVVRRPRHGDEIYNVQRLGFTGLPHLSKQTMFKRGIQLPRIRGERYNEEKLANLRWHELTEMCRSGTLGAFLSQLQKETVDGYIEDWNPALLATKANAEDMPTWNEAMNGPYAAGFWKACETELDTLIRKDCWEVVDRPRGRPVVSSTWAFKIKRYPDGSMRKLKARFCARGYEQTEGVDYFETFAPVVEWTTVRFLLTMSLILGLHTAQVDYVAAFVQADIDTEVFVEMPRGFSEPGKVLKLKKSLYGLKQSPRNHYQNLRSKLEDLGFVACDSDPCLFVSDKVIALVYVDDTLLYARNPEDIEVVIRGLQERNMELQREEDVAGFLGVHIDRLPDGTIKLTQKGLIKRIIETLNIGHLPEKRTPAKLGVLATDPNGDPPNGTFNYASVIGMLGYLQANSRLDISLAVAQCSRFTHNPKRSHEQALERIGQYLKRTANEGMILRPITSTDEFIIDIYVDSDFAGGWGYEDSGDPACVKSRTGFIIECLGCPMSWKSKLQTDIATSTMEAEYSALSMALRAAIPLLEVMRYVVSGFAATRQILTKFKTSVHEDNQGALRLARLEPGRNTPRSKFYAIKHHWFRSWLKPKEIELEYIESKLQKADILTKSLGVTAFEDNRKLSCGW
jgi:hypothetical protein